MKTQSHPASISKNAFECPHCGAYTSQSWKRLCLKDIGKSGLPWIPTQSTIDDIRNNNDHSFEAKEGIIKYVEEVRAGNIFYEGSEKNIYNSTNVVNVHTSKCFACKKICIWVHDKLIYPNQKYNIKPNADIPDDILTDFEEARNIVDNSPRGAAALLRLAIQKMCKHLGEDGKNINKDIASLVSKGLNSKIQKALDIVRVIGNDAVHPGEIDLNDNKDVAYKLFNLVNIIADEMISRPKQIDDLYSDLPQSKLDGIEKRDNKQ
ncbi:DUF4145 domain-containing protein [Marinifilum sp. JC120]|nr:DUF4145 domain-containing protein [Marinifilum sp. JC120]